MRRTSDATPTARPESGPKPRARVEGRAGELPEVTDLGPVAVATSKAAHEERREVRRRWGRRKGQAGHVLSGAISIPEIAPVEDEFTAEARASEAEAVKRLAEAQRVRSLAVTEASVQRREVSARRWKAAYAYEPDRRTLYDSLPAVTRKEINNRSTWVEITPCQLPETWTAAAARLSRGRSGRIQDKHAVAHLVVSWPEGVEPTPGQAATTCRRMMQRLGLDPDRHATAAWLHADSKATHCHLVVARTRGDGAVWMPRLGPDRAMALEARLMAVEHGDEWAQEMTTYKAIHGRGEHFYGKGQAHALMVHPDGRREKIAWQGPEVDARMERDPIALSQHAGVTLGKMIGFRPAASVCRYAGQ